VQQVDDRLHAVVSATGEGTIPEPPVVMARFRLTQTPRCPVSNDLDTEISDRAEVVVNTGIMATLGKLVLPIGNSIGKHQGVGPLFANGPRKVRKFVLGIIRICHRVANLAEDAFVAGQAPGACLNWSLGGESNS
jgi:hypothetical protein